MTCTHHYSINSEGFHWPQNPMLHPSLPIPLPQPLATIPFYCLHSFASLECHVVGVVEYAAFPDWLLSLRNMHLRFTVSL